MAPIDFETLSGERLHTNEGALGRQLWPDFVHVFLQDARATAIAKRTQTLFDHGGGDFRVLLQPFDDVALEGIEFAGTAGVSPDPAPAHPDTCGSSSSTFSDGARFCGWASAQTSKAGAGH